MRSRTKVGAIAVAMATGVALAAMTSTPTASGASPGVPTIATGHISYAAGVSSGQVMLLVDPSTTTIKQDTNGAQLATPMLASADVGSDGNFVLSLDPANVPVSDKLADGTVNVEAIAVSGGQQLPFFFVATPVQTTAGTQWVSTGINSDQTAALDFNMAAGTAVNAKYSPAKWLNNAGRQVSASKLRAASPSLAGKATPTMQKLSSSVAAGTTVDASAPCGLIPLTPKTHHGEHFVNLYVDGSATVHVAETKTSTHTLGIAVEASDGTFHAGGTSSISRNASAKWTSPEYQHSHDAWNKVWYTPFHDTCTHRNIKKVTDFYDIGSGDLDGPVTYQFFTASCGVKDKDSTYDTEQASAATFSSGVDVGGVGLSVHSGYGSSINIHIKMLEHGSINGTNPLGIYHSASINASRFGC